MHLLTIKGTTKGKLHLYLNTHSGCDTADRDPCIFITGMLSNLVVEMENIKKPTK
jgi:hypothetical protein